jgi:hypothetical protein
MYSWVGGFCAFSTNSPRDLYCTLFKSIKNIYKIAACVSPYSRCLSLVMHLIGSKTNFSLRRFIGNKRRNILLRFLKYKRTLIPTLFYCMHCIILVVNEMDNLLYIDIYCDDSNIMQYEIPSARNSQGFFHFRTFRMLYGIIRNSVQFRNSAEFSKILVHGTQNFSKT